MAQISLYIDDFTASRLSSAARMRSLSISKYVANIVAESLDSTDTDEAQKNKLLRELIGTLDDSTFSEPQDIPMVAEGVRRYELI